MKKGQVSFEYTILFTFVLLLFITFGAIFLVGLKKTDTTQYLAENLAKEIKIKTITASLTDADYTSKVHIPKSINGKEIVVEINKEPDNILYIKYPGVDAPIARAFLPKIDSVSLPSPPYDPDGFDLSIKRTGNNLEITS